MSQTASTIQRPSEAAARPFDAESLRRDFPVLAQSVHGYPLVYLDNAATTQKPVQVIEAVRHYYEHENSNVHRGVHHLSQIATERYESARETVRGFLNAASEREIIFTRGTTEGINLVAQSYGRKNVQAGDEVLISAMEHHSNIVPWQMLCEERGARLRVIPMNQSGELDLDAYEGMLNERTRIVSIVHVSNALGTINPVKRMIEMAHRRGIPVLVDGAQSVPHIAADVRDLDCDFFVFSGHKIYGPTGIGALYGKRELLESMPPYQGGGDMILSVTFEKTLYNELPYKFEAGTPNIAGAIGMAAALDWFNGFDREAVERHERALLDHATAAISAFPEVSIIGTARDKASVLSFVLCAVHPHDIGTILDQQGVAIRAGHHCAQPVMQFFGIPATARASFSLYNTMDDADRLAAAVKHVLEVFA
jgi:cysteine desulfurase/selenocysteine lyase